MRLLYKSDNPIAGDCAIGFVCGCFILSTNPIGDLNTKLIAGALFVTSTLPLIDFSIILFFSCALGSDFKRMLSNSFIDFTACKTIVPCITLFGLAI